VSPRGAFAAADRQHAERVFLELLDKSESEGRFVSHRTRAGNYAPKMFARHPDREGLRQADFDLAMQRLFAALTIKVGARKAADRKIYDVIVRSASE
jgi:hypothetical protein